MIKKATLLLFVLSAFVLAGCGNQTCSNRYSVAILELKENGGIGFLITDNNKHKTYLYLENMKEGKVVMELQGMIDLSKAGDQSIEMVEIDRTD